MSISSLLLGHLPELDHRNRPNYRLIEALSIVISLLDGEARRRVFSRIGSSARGEAIEDIDAMPTQAAFDDEDVVANEKETSGDDSDYCDCDYWEAVRA